MQEPLVWVGGQHRFLLRIGELRALQKACDAGPEEVFNRLRFGSWRIDDVIEPIRLGLIGSGEMSQSEAGPFVTGLMEKHPRALFKLTAAHILSMALFGEDEEDVPGKQEPGETSPENGVSPGSTQTEQ